MDLAVLRIFRAIVETGSVTGAAARLHRVQSNVSTRLRQLEEDLGVALFRREGRRLILTAEGQTLDDYAARLLALAEDARRAVGGDQPAGLLRIGAMESTAAVRLPAPLAALAGQFPEISVELKTGNPEQLTQMLLEDRIEAALLAIPPDDPRLQARQVFVETVVIVTAREVETLPDTALVFEAGCPHRARLEALYAKAGRRPGRIVELGSYHALLGCVLAGMGAALLPESVLTGFAERKRLRVHRLGGAEARLPTMLLRRSGTPSARMAAFESVLP
ncbi:MAG: LysR family transcriptional regulator [Rhodobacteraceae bacterium]|nr:LysR family transcriptional regulator [Paracoccaceae bacterium]